MSTHSPDLIELAVYGVACLVMLVAKATSEPKELKGFDAGMGNGNDAWMPPAAHALAAKYRLFRLGPYRGKMSRSLVPKKSGAPQGSAALPAVMTSLSVAVPQVQAFHLKIELPNSRWNALISASDEEFVRRLIWEAAEPELLDAFRRQTSVELLRRLFASGPGMIFCEGDNFSIHILRELPTEAQLDFFLKNAKDVFRIYAQVAQLNIAEWRFPENNYDWWSVAEI